MKKFIRYLYEYQNGQRVHNVGFAKVEHNDDCEIIQIYGKGFPVAGNQELEVLVFYMMDETPVGISMGKIKSTRPMCGYRLEYTPEDVGGREIFEAIDGIILLNDINGFKKWYAAVWGETNVPVEHMIRREEILRRDEDNQTEQAAEPVADDVSSDECKENEPDSPVEEECIQSEAADMPAEPAADSDNVVEECTEEEPLVSEENAPEEDAPEEDAPEPEQYTASEAEYIEVQEPDLEEETLEEEQEFIQIFKVTRKDLVQLPRKEWRLANNNFLLHGYYNYHHLISFEKDSCCWLGVPGIYHPKEQKAADAFGFGQFMKPDEGEIDFADGEMNADEDFGYWCRKVGAVIH